MSLTLFMVYKLVFNLYALEIKKKIVLISNHILLYQQIWLNFTLIT